MLGIELLLSNELKVLYYVIRRDMYIHMYIYRGIYLYVNLYSPMQWWF